MKIFRLIVILSSIIGLVRCLDPFSWAAIGGALSAGGWFLRPNCWLNECCSDRNSSLVKKWIHDGDESLNRLKYDLQNRLYGQPFAADIIYKTISKHIRDPKPIKPLVLSFHGWTGAGKNYAASFVAKNLYTKGLDSKYVHLIVGADKYTDSSQVDKYKTEINKFVKEQLASCERQLFILDEVDEIPSGVLDAYLPFFEYSRKEGNKAIFLIIGNSGGSAIAQYAYTYHLQGKSRETLDYRDLINAIDLAAFNEKGGLLESRLIEKNLIDHYVPFLPLERHHIKKCVRDYLRDRYNITKSTDDDFIVKISNELDYYPPNTQVYSKSGCKKVKAKVDVLL